MADKALAIIPARGGSKRVPNKNIKYFLGKPIISYPIKIALRSKLFNEVIVSTDSKKIAEIAKKYGAKVPFYRSRKNSDDYATTSDVLKEVLLEYKKSGKEFKYFCCIYPTAVFATVKLLKKGLNLLKKKNVDSVIPVTPFEYPIQRALKIEDGFLKWRQAKYRKSRSQDLEELYHDCGMFYWCKTFSLFKNNQILSEKTLPLKISRNNCQDIDVSADWRFAELKYKNFQNLK